MSQGTLFRDPALCGHATGDEEQTISKIPKNGFIFGPDADGRSTPLQGDRLGSIPTVSTMINTVATC
jgi:hypothetical protein